MIVKRNFSPVKVWGYIWREVSFALLWSLFIWILFDVFSFEALSISFTPVGILGSALAIFVAFRNNAAYGRWWEARQIWGGIVNSSRVFARLVFTFVDSHKHQANYDSTRSEQFKVSMIKRQIAWVHALRLHLRHQSDWEILKPHLPNVEFDELMRANNKPNYLQLLMGKHIYEAMSNGTLAGFDSFQMEGQLLALANYQGACERIKNTPLPRQYDYFTRLFVWLFVLLLPFGLLSITSAGMTWISVPLATIIAAVFSIMEKTGSANEDPFENLTTDVPLTALCNTIERDLLEMLPGQEVPQKLEPVNGYLM